ncbi:d7.3 [Tranosema rostrale ichnovirus]|nr:d7.3 [Tranosema rostrale ichnovirus]
MNTLVHHGGFLPRNAISHLPFSQQSQTQRFSLTNIHRIHHVQYKKVFFFHFSNQTSMRPHPTSFSVAHLPWLTIPWARENCGKPVPLQLVLGPLPGAGATLHSIMKNVNTSYSSIHM